MIEIMLTLPMRTQYLYTSDYSLSTMNYLTVNGRSVIFRICITSTRIFFSTSSLPTPVEVLLVSR